MIYSRFQIWSSLVSSRIELHEFHWIWMFSSKSTIANYGSHLHAHHHYFNDLLPIFNFKSAERNKKTPYATFADSDSKPIKRADYLLHFPPFT